MNDREKLHEVICRQSIKHGDFTLASGLKSTYYIDGKMTTFDPEGALLVGKVMFKMIRDLPFEVNSIGGPTMGADPIVAGVGIASFLENDPVRLFAVRKKTKGHGTQKLIEGNFKEGDNVVIVEDVITTGGSIFQAIEAVEESGGIIKAVIVIVDRQQGGQDNVEKKGYMFKSIFKIDELLKK
ncbi:orotate phosphoribosyltransferase [candidate division KSB1 bacterium]